MDFVEAITEVMDEDRPERLYLAYHHNSDFVIEASLFERAGGKRLDEVKQMPDLHVDLKDLNLRIEPVSVYPHSKCINLSHRSMTAGRSLEEVIWQRRSLRRPIPHNMTLGEVAYVLEYSTGQTFEFRSAGKPGRFRVRAAPSAGGLYPIEVYAIPLTVDTLELGVYHYEPYDHALQRLERDIALDQVKEGLAFVTWVMDASMLLILTAKFDRLEFKYGERSYRYALIEAGAILEHAMLLSEALGLRGVMIGGYADNLVNAMLGCNGVDEAVLICGAIGKEDKGG